MMHHRLDRAARDKVTAWALGTMGVDEKATFESHLDACEICRGEADVLRETLDGMETLAPEAVPPPDVLPRVMDRIRATAQEHASPSVQVWKEWAGGDASANAGFYLQRATKSAWEATGIAGIEVRRLFVDAANDRATMLVRMAPGTSYPSHRHANVEECLVLDGELNVGELRMKAGDYQRASGGSAHVVQSTDTGCTLFIVSSLHDELLTSA